MIPGIAAKKVSTVPSKSKHDCKVTLQYLATTNGEFSDRRRWTTGGPFVPVPQKDLARSRPFSAEGSWYYADGRGEDPRRSAVCLLRNRSEPRTTIETANGANLTFSNTTDGTDL